MQTVIGVNPFNVIILPHYDFMELWLWLHLSGKLGNVKEKSSFIR